MNRYCLECLKKAKDDCDGTDPKPVYQLRGKIFTTGGLRHGLDFCRHYEFNPQMMPPIVGNAGSQEEFKAKVKAAKAECKVKREKQKEYSAAIRKAEKLQKQIDDAQAIAYETIAEAKANANANANTETKAVVDLDDDFSTSLQDLEDLLI